MGFAHLHVASGFSMRHGASTPEVLVERAAQHGQPALALTDRDGLYGAVRFVRAATAAGLVPVLGVDLAMDHSPGRHGEAELARRLRSTAAASRPFPCPRRRPRRPAPAAGDRPRPGRGVRHPAGRGVGGALPARHRDPPGGRAGHAGLHPGRPRPCNRDGGAWLHGTDGRASAASTWPYGGSGGTEFPLCAMLGPDSDVGRAVLAKQHDLARSLLHAWRRLLPPGAVVVEVVCHGGPDGTPGSRGHARRMLALADETGTPAVLTAVVRHVDPADSRTIDVLDAARRLVVLDPRHLDRTTDAGHLASTDTMLQVAADVAGPQGTGRAQRLVRATLDLATTCGQHARRDLGIGSVQLPEPSALGIPDGTDPQGVLEERCRNAVARRYPGASDALLHTVHTRLTEELKVIADLGYPTYFLTVAEVTDLIKARGVRCAARGSGAGSLVNHLLGISGVDPIRHDLLMERFCSPLRAELPDIDVDVESARRTEIYEAVLDRFGGERVTCVSMMDTYKVRHAIRDVGAALGMPPVEIDEIAKAFPHISARNARQAIAELPELRMRGLDAPRLQTLFDLVERLDGLPRHIALHPCGVVLSNGSAPRPDPGRGELARLPDEPVRQGRRRAPRPAQARRPRHPDAVGDGARRRRGRPGRRRMRSTSTTRRACRSTTRRRIG